MELRLMVERAKEIEEKNIILNKLYDITYSEVQELSKRVRELEELNSKLEFENRKMKSNESLYLRVIREYKASISVFRENFKNSETPVKKSVKQYFITNIFRGVESGKYY